MTLMAGQREHEPTASDIYKNHLADKRTILASLRTGIAILTLPMSMITVLIATSSHYDIHDVLALFLSLIIICGILLLIGIYMMIRSFNELFRVNGRLNTLVDHFDYLHPNDPCLLWSKPVTKGLTR